MTAEENDRIASGILAFDGNRRIAIRLLIKFDSFGRFVGMDHLKDKHRRRGSRYSLGWLRFLRATRDNKSDRNYDPDAHAQMLAIRRSELLRRGPVRNRPRTNPK